MGIAFPSVSKLGSLQPFLSPVSGRQGSCRLWLTAQSTLPLCAQLQKVGHAIRFFMSATFIGTLISCASFVVWALHVRSMQFNRAAFR